VKALLRAYSYIFEGLLDLFALVVSCVALTTGSPLNLGFLPWPGAKLSYWLLSLALLGLLFLLMAMGGKLRALFFLWSLTVFVLLFRGFFLTAYSFSGPVKFQPAVWLTVGALFGAIGAWPWKKRDPVRRPMKY
jgi:hypothetical protein